MNRQPKPPGVPPAGRAQGQEEPEQADEADIPSDDGGPADEAQAQPRPARRDPSEGEGRRSGEVERE